MRKAYTIYCISKGVNHDFSRDFNFSSCLFIAEGYMNNNISIIDYLFYGQFIYFYLNENSKKNAKGFLDGDQFKINKRLSGTPLYIYEKKYISHFENITILITSAKHHTEIKNELLQYNSNITFINSF